MSRGRTLIRLRSRQEQMRQRLLMIGIPLLTIGSSLIWYFSRPAITQTEIPPAVSSTPLVATSKPADTPLPAERQDSPPAIPQEPNATVATSDTNTTPVPLVTSASASVTTPSPINPISPSTLVANSVNDTPAPTANTSLAAPLAALPKPLENTPAPTEALPNNPRLNNTNIASTDKTKPSTPESPKAATPLLTPTAALPQTEVSLVNEPKVPKVENTPKATTPTVVINASTRGDTNTPTSKVSSSTLMALTGGIPVGSAQVHATPAEVPTSAITNTTRQDANVSTETSSKGAGWIYAGQFSNGVWTQRGLVIGNQLPVQGQRYQLAAGAKLRDTPPGRRVSGNLGEAVGFLNSGQSVQIVQVKNSGNTGHIWLQIAR